jgi:hypothetical protein
VEVVLTAARWSRLRVVAAVTLVSSGGVGVVGQDLRGRATGGRDLVAERWGLSGQTGRRDGLCRKRSPCEPAEANRTFDVKP